MNRPEPAASSWTRRDWAGVAAVFLAVAWVYSPLRHGGLIWNDPDYVTAPALRSWRGLGRIWFKVGATEQYYPLLHSFFWLQWRAFAGWAPGYHAINGLLHACNACLVAAVLRALLPRAHAARSLGPWLAALLFAVHPVEVESVAWISEQKNTLSTLLYLGSMGWYLRFDRDRSRGAYRVAFGLFGGALLAKTMTATLPGALGLLIWWRNGRLEWRRDLIPLLPWCVAGAAAGLFSGFVERTYIGAAGPAFALAPAQRLLVAGRAIWFYAGKIFWPTHLMFIYPRWVPAAAALEQWLFPAAAIALSIALWLLRRRSRTPLACWLFFVGSLFPILGFLNVYAFIFSFVADHFQYLASLGLLGAIGVGVAAAAARAGPAVRVLTLAAAGIAVALLAVAAREAVLPFCEVGQFYRTILARNPQSWLAWNNLGLLAYDAGDRATAVADYRRALALRPDFPEAHNNLGIALADLGRWAESESALRSALTDKFPFPQAEFNLSRPLVATGRVHDAEIAIRDALGYFPEKPEMHVALGNVLQAQKRNREAIAEYETALRLRPGYAEALNNEGASRVGLGEIDAAMACFAAAVRSRPDYADAHYNWGLELVAQGQVHEAIVQFTIANRLDPRRPDVYRELGKLLQRSGHPEEAARFFRLAASPPSVP